MWLLRAVVTRFVVIAEFAGVFAAILANLYHQFTAHDPDQQTNHV